MNVQAYKTGIILTDIKHFGLRETLDNGSTFRWTELTPTRFLGIVNNKVLQMVEVGNHRIFIDNLTISEFENYYYDYFDMHTDYDKAYDRLLQDKIFRELVPSSTPLRLLKQDFVESFISAYISQNNNITRIKFTIENICQYCGDNIFYQNRIFKSFPNLETLSKISVSRFKELGLGYRAEGLTQAIKILREIEIAYGDLNLYFQKFTYSDLKYFLLDFKGIGNKVADFIITMTGKCIGYENAFVVDVWIKRAMKDLYNIDICSTNMMNILDSIYGEYKALAQQNIFFYYRKSQN